MSEMTKPDLKWLLTFVDNYEHVLHAYPELFKAEDEDDMKIVRQILEENLNE